MNARIAPGATGHEVCFVGQRHQALEEGLELVAFRAPGLEALADDEWLFDRADLLKGRSAAGTSE